MVVAPVVRRDNQSACSQTQQSPLSFDTIYTGVNLDSDVPRLADDIFGEVFKVF